MSNFSCWEKVGRSEPSEGVAHSSGGDVVVVLMTSNFFIRVMVIALQESIKLSPTNSEVTSVMLKSEGREIKQKSLRSKYE